MQVRPWLVRDRENFCFLALQPVVCAESQEAALITIYAVRNLTSRYALCLVDFLFIKPRGKYYILLSLKFKKSS